MTKKKTPIGQLLEELDKHIKPSCSDHTPFRGICQNCHNHNVFNVLDLNPEKLVEKIKSLLPTERDIIIKSNQEGLYKTCANLHTTFDDCKVDAETYFTQTFESYE